MLRIAIAAAHALPSNRKRLAPSASTRGLRSAEIAVDIGVLAEVRNLAGPHCEHMGGAVAARSTTADCAVGPNHADDEVGAGLAHVLDIERQVAPPVTDGLEEPSHVGLPVEMPALRKRCR